MFRLLFVSLLVVVLASTQCGAIKAEYENVLLELYIESGCPVSQAFLLGTLTNVLAMPDIAAITTFKYVPFGNTFFNKTIATYQCYDDCECESDSIELCSLYKFTDDISAINTGANSYAVFPFISCMEANAGVSSFGEKCWTSTMSSLTTLTWSDIYNCSVNEFTRVMTAGDLATPQWLTSVPLVIVDSVVLTDPDAMLLSSICAAYEGPTPASCLSIKK